MSIQQIVKQTHHSSITISKVLHNHGIDVGLGLKQYKPTLEEIEKVKQIINNHGSIREASRIIGRDQTIIKRIIQDNNLIYDYRPYNKNLKHDFFDIIDSQEKAWLLGFLFTDGSVRRVGNSYQIRLSIQLKDEEIIFSFMGVKKNGIENHSGFVTGKLFTREICAKAFSYLPIIFCTMGEDFVLYTMFTYFAKKYKGISCVVYSYSCDTGVTSKKTIDTLEKWEKVCSAASAFTVLFNLIKNEPEIKMPFECVESIKVQCRRILRNNISQMHTSVPEKLIPEARNMLCDYWGSDFVAEIEKDYYSCDSATENSSDAE